MPMQISGWYGHSLLVSLILCSNTRRIRQDFGGLYRYDIPGSSVLHHNGGLKDHAAYKEEDHTNKKSNNFYERGWVKLLGKCSKLANSELLKKLDRTGDNNDTLGFKMSKLSDGHMEDYSPNVRRRGSKPTGEGNFEI